MKKPLLFFFLLAFHFASYSQNCSVKIQQADTVLCLGRSVQLTATGTGPFSYSWSPSAGLSDNTIPNPIATPDVTTSYIVRVSSPDGCAAYDTVVITIQDCPFKADFSATVEAKCLTQTYLFTDLSTGNPEYFHWDFGDGTTSIEKNATHFYSSPGTYSVKLEVVKGWVHDSVVKIITVRDNPIPVLQVTESDTCSIFSRTFQFKITTVGSIIGSYRWSFGDGTFSSMIAPSHTYTIPGVYTVRVVVENPVGCIRAVGQYVGVETYKPIVPAAGALTLKATSECTDSSGWTNYFNDNNTPQNTRDDILLLSLKKNGNNIGTIGNGTFDVSVSADAGAGSNTGILLTNPLITNSSGFWVMNRYWQVKPTTQPTTPIPVRFYFNRQDLNDVNGSYPSHNLNFTDLLFYKTIGGNPDPTTNLQGASRIISLVNGSSADTTHWKYTSLDSNRHMAEFMVTSFSGGGGGATGNGSVLPLQLLSFTAIQQQHDVILNWKIDVDAGIEKYVVEKSLNGFNFTEASTILPANSIDKTSFTFIDKNAADNGKNIFYRVKMQEKNGSFTYSKTELINIKNNSGITISPNPARNFIILHSTFSTANSRLVLFDNLGRKVFETHIVSGVNERVNLPALKNGSYHVQLLDNGKQIHNQNILVIK